MLRVVSINVNGIRSAAKKGFFDWLPTINADFICLQEVRASNDQLTDAIFTPEGYHCHYHEALKKGYSGVALYSKKMPDKTHTQLGFATADDEARFIQMDFADLSVVSLYCPSGTSGDERQVLKMQFMDELEYLFNQYQKSGRHFIICGDFNIAHKKIDIKNWRGNQKNSGFLPEERAWMDKLFDQMQFVDAFRVLNQEADQYTWWSNRGQAYANNVGWRIDYQVVTPALAAHIKHVDIYKNQKFSDHAPLIIDYDI